MNSDIKKELKRLSKLKQNKGKSDAKLENIAQLNIWKRQIKIEDKFILEDDKKLAKDLFDNYLSNYEFDSFSDLNTLSDLIYEEVLKTNLQKQLNNIYKDNSNKLIPDKLINSLHTTEERVLKLKERLKIGVDDETKDDNLSALEKLKERFKKYIPFNRNEFTMVCGSCGEIQLLRRKVKNFKALKHPFFAGRFYYNRRAIELVKAGIISKEIYAFIMNTSTDFVTWCLEHENEIPEIDEVTKEEVKEFIDKTEYLKKPRIPKNIKKDEV